MSLPVSPVFLGTSMASAAARWYSTEKGLLAGYQTEKYIFSDEYIGTGDSESIV